MYETLVGLLFYGSISVFLLVAARSVWKAGRYIDRLRWNATPKTPCVPIIPKK